MDVSFCPRAPRPSAAAAVPAAAAQTLDRYDGGDESFFPVVSSALRSWARGARQEILATSREACGIIKVPWLVSIVEGPRSWCYCSECRQRSPNVPLL
jgi:hypothetical protein